MEEFSQKSKVVADKLDQDTHYSLHKTIMPLVTYIEEDELGLELKELIDASLS